MTVCELSKLSHPVMVSILKRAQYRHLNELFLLPMDNTYVNNDIPLVMEDDLIGFKKHG